MPLKIRKDNSWFDITGSVTTGTTKVALLWDQKAQNVDGGNFVSGDWQDRTLNSETDPQDFVGLNEGHIYWSLPAGTYKITWSAPAHGVERHQTRLLYADNTSFNSSSNVLGSSQQAWDAILSTQGGEDQQIAEDNRSFGEAVVTVSAENTYFKIQHQCSGTRNTTGFGFAANFGPEVYTQVRIEDLATAVKGDGGSGGGGGSSTFIGLTDTPSSYVQDKWLKVNSQANALEFTDAPAGQDTTYDLITSQDSTNVKLTLDASTGDDDPVLITAGSNITLTEDGSGTGFTIAASSSSVESGKTKFCILEDVKGNEEQGGTFTGQEWVTRNFNSINDNGDIGITINSANVITLPVGKYRVKWSAPAFSVQNHQTRLVYSTQSNFPTPLQTIPGSSEWTPVYNYSWQTRSFGETIIIANEQTFIKLQHKCHQTRDDDGLGIGSWSGENGIFSQLLIEDLSTAIKEGAIANTGKTRVALLKDQKNFGVNGGGFTKDGWRDRDLTVEEDPQNFVNFIAGGSQSDPSGGNTPGYWSLPAGTYRIDWSAPAYDVNRHKSRLVWSTVLSEISTAGLSNNIITNNNIAEGAPAETTNVDTGGGNDDEHVKTNSDGYKIITIPQITYFKILHWSIVDKSNDGLGFALSPGGSYDTGPEIYTQVRIEDLATAVKDNATYVEGNTKVAIVKDQKNGGVQGGDFNQGWWRDRDLTVEDDPFDFVELYPTPNGQNVKSGGITPGYFSLPAGKYKISFNAVAHDVARNLTAMGWSPTQSNINKTYQSGDFDGGYFYGTSMACAGASTLSKGSEVVEISETSFFKVIHYSTATNSDSGFGQSVMGSADKETYLIIEIEDLATAVKNDGGSGGGSGSVTSVDISSTNATLSTGGGPITDSGTLTVDMPVTGVTAGNYTNTDLTVDAYGRITAASNGSGGGGGGSGLSPRGTNSASTAPIVKDGSDDISITTQGKSYSLLKVEINQPAWVVLYVDSASRTSDSSRSEGTDPAPGAGVIAEVSSTTAGSSTFLMTPGVLGWNNDSTPAETVYAKVTNRRSTSGSNPIVVTLTTLKLES